MIRWPSLRSVLLRLFAPSPSSFSTRAIAWEHLRTLRLLKEAETRAREAEEKLLAVTAERDELAARAAAARKPSRRRIIEDAARAALSDGPVGWSEWGTAIDEALDSHGEEDVLISEMKACLSAIGAEAKLGTVERVVAKGSDAPIRDTEPGPSRLRDWDYDEHD